MVQAAQSILIKRYGGRRLYDTHDGRYVTVDSIADRVRDGQRVVIRDAQTGRDITSAVLETTIPEDE